MDDGLRKGDTIKCHACKKVIYIAAVDIPFEAEFASRYLTYFDGKPVDFAAELICPHCGNQFETISTTEGMTG